MMAIQLLALCAVFAVLAAQIRKAASREFSWFLFALFSVLVVLQVLSYYTTGRPFNYQVYAHLDIASFRMAFELFWPQVLLIPLLVVILTIAFGMGAKILNSQSPRRRRLQYAVLLGSIIVMLVPREGILRSAGRLAGSFAHSDTDMALPTRLAGYGIKDYVFKEDVTAESGKNVVLISLESFERGFLDDEAFPGVASNLREMSRTWTYFPHLEQGEGAEWTSGALYGLLTGMPALFGIHGNTIMQTATRTRLAGLGDAFQTAGYKMVWFMSDPVHAGNARLLDTFGFRVFHDESVSLADFRMTDADLFENAKKMVREYSETNRPFVIGISTLSTHHPDGIADERFSELRRPGDSGITHMARVTDTLVKDFCDFVLSLDDADNTVIFILPDHLAMPGSSALTQLKAAGPRSLYLITNASPDDLRTRGAEPITTFDLPRLVLDGARVTSNIRFMRDLVGPEAFDDIDFTALNLSFWGHNNTQNGIKIAFGDFGTIGVWANGSMQFQSEAELEITPGNDIVIASGIPTTNLIIRLDYETKSMCIGTQDHMTSCFSGNDTISFSKEEIDFVRELHRHAVFKNTAHDNHVTITSSGDPLLQSSVIFGTVREDFDTPGLVLVRKDSLRTGFFPDDRSPDGAQTFVRALQAELGRQNLLAVLTHGDVSPMVGHVARELEAAGLPALAGAEPGRPYIAVGAEGDTLVEFPDVGLDTVTAMVPQVIIPIQDDTETPPAALRRDAVPTEALDPMRLIAHAGGAIDGKTYTNSLEAIDESYRRGFRMFELDIVTTSDGHFVAAHDWKHWQEITDYSGRIPPTREQFLGAPIFGHLTPMDMDRINSWFAAHTDAVLVTDKVNEPMAVAGNFVDPSRLMMELFTEDALEEASTTGIALPICTFHLLKTHYRETGELRSFLEKYDLKAVGMPLRYVSELPVVTRYLRDNNVHVLAFTSNDPRFIATNVGTTIYGVYTDTWHPQGAPN